VSLNVLIVDDSAVMRQMISKILRLSGIPIGAIAHAGNGLEGLRSIEECAFDLVLADINMPLMNGEQMIERIRENPGTAGVPVIVVSTDGSAARVEMMRKRGAGFVHKPFSPETLRDRIIEVMGRSYDELLAESAVQSDGPDF
jgi:two-component system, chemotaxis family, chemotaxis protein CheY